MQSPYHFETKTLVKVGGGRGGGIQISSDKDDQRIFWGLKFLISGFFGVVKYGEYFLGWLELSRDFFWLLRTL